jgi:hypothetical protein
MWRGGREGRLVMGGARILALLRAIAILTGASTVALYPSQGTAQPAPDPVAQTMVGQLQSAILRNDAEQLAAFSKVGFNLPLLGDDGRRLMFLAAEEAQETTIDALIGLGGDVNARDDMGYTLVMAALAAGNLDNALLFRHRGVKLDAVGHDGHSAETLAEFIGAEGFESGRTAAVLTLDQAQADRLLLLAVEHSDLEGANLALANGASVGASASNGWSAMMLAALAGDEDILSLLVSELERDGADGLAIERNRTVGEDKFDVVLAALVGEGGGPEPDHQKVVELLDRLRTDLFDGSFPAGRVRLYRSVAERIGYDLSVVALALQLDADAERGVEQGPLPEFLPALEYDLPFGIPSDREGWLKVQRTLKAEGLYDGNIDGIPGPGTYSALLSYIEPLQQILADRAIEAIRRSSDRGDQDKASSRFGYDVVGDYAGEYRTTRIDAREQQVPAGYTGHAVFGETRVLANLQFTFGGDAQLKCTYTNDDPIVRGSIFRCPFLDGVMSLTSTNDSTYLSLNFGSGDHDVLTLAGSPSWTRIPPIREQ